MTDEVRRLIDTTPDDATTRWPDGFDPPTDAVKERTP
jgi:hypothetical protein